MLASENAEIGLRETMPTGERDTVRHSHTIRPRVPRLYGTDPQWYEAVISFVGKQIRKYAKKPLGTIFFGWCLLYSQVMHRDFVRPTNTQIDKYK